MEIFLGDYIDRGPASREVLDRLVARSRARETVCLKGNHETFIQSFLSDPTILDSGTEQGVAFAVAGVLLAKLPPTS